MTRRELALKACVTLKHGESFSLHQLHALVDEYNDLLAFFDAMENEGLEAAWEHYREYCENQEKSSTRGKTNE